MSRLFSFIQEGEIHTTGEKIVRAEDYSTLLEASAILERAKEEIENYKKAVEKECEQLKEQAKKEGFDTGLGQFNDKVLELDKEIKRLRHEMNKLILPLALKAAKKIVARELETHPEAIVDIVLQAITPAMQNHKVTIYVNKAEKDVLEAQKPKIKQILDQVESLTIRERDDISPGGCVIETETGIINAQIENQWRALEAAFERYLKH